MKVLSFLLFLLISVGTFAQTSNGLPEKKTAIANLEKDIPELMKEASIPGFAIALIRENKIAWTRYFGYANATEKNPVTASTIFEAASLTKVVTAYAVFKLVDQGKLSLDVPLTQYIGNNYDAGDDIRIKKITARMVLSHSAGFPNWRGDSKLLPINFEPGEKFSYSGEGFVYLAHVAEKLTGKKFQDLVRETVLQPLGMKNSSFVWIDAYEKTGAHRHDVFGQPTSRNQGRNSNAAASLRTTLDDYATFMIAVMSGTGLKEKTAKEMLLPQVNVDAKSPEVFWGLGVGLEVRKDGRSFWHWGDQGDTKAWFIADPGNKSGVVYFANASDGLSIVKKIVDDAVGGEHPAITWLDYDQYNSATKMVMRSIVKLGAAEALKIYNDDLRQDKITRINEDQFNNMGYQLMSAKRLDDALVVFIQNTVDYPESANVWDSLAECYLNKGDKQMAIKYYEKANELNPNGGAKEQLKKLRE